MDDITKAEPEIVIKRFTSVLFGVNSSAFLLSATIAIHMKKFIDINKNFVTKFLQDLYMDDSVTGVQNLDEAFDFYIFVKTLMFMAGFELTKWHSNSNKLLEAVRKNEKLYYHYNPAEEYSGNDKKILGIIWNSKTDQLLFNFKEIIEKALNNDVVTKRLVLKVVASIYDPFGILSPAVVQLKFLFQEVCALKCNWNIVLLKEFISKWRNTLSSFLQIDVIIISRHYLFNYDINDVVKLELHGFSDASLKAVAGE